MLNWTNPYTPPTIAGVTAGTLSVPTFVPSDWRLTKRDTAGNKYVHYNENGGFVELEVNQNVVNNIYGNSGIAGNEQIALLQGRSAYARLRLFGPASDADCTCMSGLAPLSVALNVTVPTGVTVTEQNIQDVLSVLISVFSDAITTGTVVPMSDALDMTMGAINK